MEPITNQAKIKDDSMFRLNKIIDSLQTYDKKCLHMLNNLAGGSHKNETSVLKNKLKKYKYVTHHLLKSANYFKALAEYYFNASMLSGQYIGGVNQKVAKLKDKMEGMRGAINNIGIQNINNVEKMEMIQNFITMLEKMGPKPTKVNVNLQGSVEGQRALFSALSATVNDVPAQAAQTAQTGGTTPEELLKIIEDGRKHLQASSANVNFLNSWMADIQARLVQAVENSTGLIELNVGLDWVVRQLDKCLDGKCEGTFVEQNVDKLRDVIINLIDEQKQSNEENSETIVTKIKELERYLTMLDSMIKSSSVSLRGLTSLSKPVMETEKDKYKPFSGSNVQAVAQPVVAQTGGLNQFGRGNECDDNPTDAKCSLIYQKYNDMYKGLYENTTNYEHNKNGFSFTIKRIEKPDGKIVITDEDKSKSVNWTSDIALSELIKIIEQLKSLEYVLNKVNALCSKLKKNPNSKFWDAWTQTFRSKRTDYYTDNGILGFEIFCNASCDTQSQIMKPKEAKDICSGSYEIHVGDIDIKECFTNAQKKALNNESITDPAKKVLEISNISERIINTCIFLTSVYYVLMRYVSIYHVLFASDEKLYEQIRTIGDDLPKTINVLTEIGTLKTETFRILGASTTEHIFLRIYNAATSENIKKHLLSDDDENKYDQIFQNDKLFDDDNFELFKLALDVLMKNDRMEPSTIRPALSKLIMVKTKDTFGSIDELYELIRNKLGRTGKSYSEELAGFAEHINIDSFGQAHEQISKSLSGGAFNKFNKYARLFLSQFGGAPERPRLTKFMNKLRENLEQIKKMLPIIVAVIKLLNKHLGIDDKSSVSSNPIVVGQSQTLVVSPASQQEMVYEEHSVKELTPENFTSLFKLYKKVREIVNSSIQSYLRIIPMIFFAIEYPPSRYRSKDNAYDIFDFDKNEQKLIRTPTKDSVKQHASGNYSGAHAAFLESSGNNSTTALLDDPILGLNKIIDMTNDASAPKNKAINMIFALGASGTGKTTRYFSNEGIKEGPDAVGIIPSLIAKKHGNVSFAYFVCYGQADPSNFDFREILLFFTNKSLEAGTEETNKYIPYTMKNEAHVATTYTDFYSQLVNIRLQKLIYDEDVSKILQGQTPITAIDGKATNDVMPFREILEKNNDIWFSLDGISSDNIQKIVRDKFNELLAQQKKIFTVMPTRNNIESSRGHTCVLLKFKTADESVEYFPLFDMAGTEDPKQVADFFGKINKRRMAKLIQKINNENMSLLGDDEIQNEDEREISSLAELLTKSKPANTWLISQQAGGKKKEKVENVVNEITKTIDLDEHYSEAFLGKLQKEGLYINHTIAMLIYAAVCVGNSIRAPIENNSDTFENLDSPNATSLQSENKKVCLISTQNIPEKTCDNTRYLTDGYSFGHILAKNCIWAQILFTFLYWNDETLASAQKLLESIDNTSVQLEKSNIQLYVQSLINKYPNIKIPKTHMNLTELDTFEGSGPADAQTLLDTMKSNGLQIVEVSQEHIMANEVIESDSGSITEYGFAINAYDITSIPPKPEQVQLPNINQSLIDQYGSTSDIQAAFTDLATFFDILESNMKNSMTTDSEPFDEIYGKPVINVTPKSGPVAIAKQSLTARAASRSDNISKMTRLEGFVQSSDKSNIQALLFRNPLTKILTNAYDQNKIGTNEPNEPTKTTKTTRTPGSKAVDKLMPLLLVALNADIVDKITTKNPQTDAFVKYWERRFNMLKQLRNVLKLFQIDSCFDENSGLLENNILTKMNDKMKEYRNSTYNKSQFAGKIDGIKSQATPSALSVIGKLAQHDEHNKYNIDATLQLITSIAEFKKTIGAIRQNNLSPEENASVELMRVKDGRAFATKITLMHLITGQSAKKEMVEGTLELCQMLFNVTNLKIDD